MPVTKELPVNSAKGRSLRQAAGALFLVYAAMVTMPGKFEVTLRWLDSPAKLWRLSAAGQSDDWNLPRGGASRLDVRVRALVTMAHRQNLAEFDLAASLKEDADRFQRYVEAPMPARYLPGSEFVFGPQSAAEENCHRLDSERSLALNRCP